MVARHSDAAKLSEAKTIARSANLFIVTKPDCFLLYRLGEPSNVYIGKRKSIDGILKFVHKCA